MCVNALASTPNRRNQSGKVVVSNRAAGLLLERRFDAHHLGHGDWLSRVPVWVWPPVAQEDSHLRYEDLRCGRATNEQIGRSNHGGRTVPQTPDRSTVPQTADR